MLITNGKIITWEDPNQILEGQAIFISSGRIAEIGPQDQLVALHQDSDLLDAD